jgi:hypothetical protein
MIRRIVAASLCVIAGTAAAAAQPAPPPGCVEEVHDDFDFWVGEWNVYAPDGGPYQGHNSIVKTHGGCLVTEHWQGAGGSSGDSMNFYDPLEGAWRQVWVSRGTFIDYTGGLDETGAMVLEGEIFYPGRDTRAPFRGTWTLQEDGSVRQHFQQQGEDGVWADWFVGIYVREDEDPRAEEAEAARQAP